MDNKVGLQLFTLRDYLKTPEDISRTLHKVSEIGYRIVQISALGPIDPQELRDILDRENLQGTSTHISYQELIENIDEVIEKHKILGASIAVCPGLSMDLHNKEGYKKVAKELDRVAEILQKEGIKLAYHNHGIEFEKYGDKLGIEILFEESEYLLAEIDTYWVQYGGGDPAYWCEKLKDRLILLHIKDMGIKDNQQIMLPIGEGNLNWERIFQAIKGSPCEALLVEQDICQIDPFESVKISLENLNSNLTVKG
ncbi:MAG: sugar phosphate isomerase/epimerase [Caldiserica bacterium]|nr:sugar phosphate isomerase/epimerase [Caldisericota bacterium]